MNEDEKILSNKNLGRTKLNQFQHHKKMKVESETKGIDLISKRIPNIKEKVSFIYPSISVETISIVLNKAEQNINQGIQLLKEINNKGFKDNKSNSSLTKQKRKKRNYLASIEDEEKQKTYNGDNNILNNKEPISQDIENNNRINFGNNKESEIIQTETEIKAQKMVDEIERITSRDGLRRYLLNQFPSLLSVNKEFSIISKEKMDCLQEQLQQIINFNQQLTQDIAISYNQYEVLKKDNDKNIPLLCNAISKLESNIETLENELEEKRLETTKNYELVKKENQSELVLALEYAREGY